MNKNIKCKSNFKVPAGVLGAEPSTSSKEEDKIVFPAVTKIVSVSFNIEDCKLSNIECLDESILDHAISRMNDLNSLLSRGYNFISGKTMSLNEKKDMVLKASFSSTLNDFMSPLSKKDIQYFDKLFSHLECLTGLKFELMHQHNFSSSDYKISLCGITNNILRDQMQEEAHAYVSLENKPTQCFIAVNNLPDSDPSAAGIENTLGHEILHCLGLNHPSYKSIKENKEHRSILEDRSPVQINCYKTSSSLKQAIKCTNFPNIPTGDDVCALIDLYGQSANESSYCNKIAEDFVASYSKIVEFTGATHNAEL